MPEIGASFGISRERVRQILKAQGVEERHYGAYVDPKQVQEMAEFYKSGNSIRASAAHFNRSIRVIQNKLRETVGTRDIAEARKFTSRRIPNEIRMNICQVYKVGESINDIAKEISMSPSSIFSILKQEGYNRSRKEAWKFRKLNP